MQRVAAFSILAAAGFAAWAGDTAPKRKLGQEHAVERHFNEADLISRSALEIVRYGKQVFDANWTEQDGAGRPMMKGTDRMLTDPGHPLTGMRSFNRFSGPDANSCMGCHSMPFGISGGSGDFASSVFVLGQRFDFLNFDPANKRPTGASLDETGHNVSLASAANLRKSPGLMGAGYLEMLAREMTADLQEIRDTIRLGESRELQAKGVRFGILTRRKDGVWDTSQVAGLPRQSTDAATPLNKPSLVIRPWHQAGNVVSLREFSNNAFHQHHGMQSVERFGLNCDPDGDGVMNELTRADITAVSLYQAALQVPGRVIPRDSDVEAAVLRGEAVFSQVGCASCHRPELPLTRQGWTFQEPGPYNPSTNARPGDLPAVSLDLNHPGLPQPRLHPDRERPDLLYVPAYTDMRLHDITDPADDSAAEPLNQNETVWSPKFRKGNRFFLTSRLWGAANQPPYFHHGQYTTLRQAILGHNGEALASRKRFQALSEDDRDAVIEFLKTMRVLPPDVKFAVVDENFQPREWPPLAK